MCNRNQTKHQITLKQRVDSQMHKHVQNSWEFDQFFGLLQANGRASWKPAKLHQLAYSRNEVDLIPQIAWNKTNFLCIITNQNHRSAQLDQQSSVFIIEKPQNASTVRTSDIREKRKRLNLSKRAIHRWRRYITMHCRKNWNKSFWERLWAVEENWKPIGITIAINLQLQQKNFVNFCPFRRNNIILQYSSKFWNIIL